MNSPLFNDGWREPGDDAKRMLYYVAWVLAFIGGSALMIYSAIAFFRREAVDPELGEQSDNPVFSILFFALGALTVVRVGMRLYPEIKHARQRKLTADALVASGILAGFALIFLGLERIPAATEGRSDAGIALIVIGVASIVISFLSGVAIVLWPKIGNLPKTLENAQVETRYAIDQRLMEIDDHPNPVEEDCIPMVRLRTSEGKVLNLRAGSVAYDMAEPGMRGTARIAGNRLKSFQPSRTR